GGLQCHAQRILADGTEQFGHNGVEVSVSPADRTMPAVSFNPATDETFVVWREESGVQFGVYGQKLSADGARQWTDTGRMIAPLSSTELVQVGQVQRADGAIAFWVETLSFGNQRVHAARVDTDGDYVWTSETVYVSSVASSNSRLMGAAVGDDGAILIWSDGRDDANDIYGQNINSDGTLGVLLVCDGDANGDGLVDPLDSGFVLARFGCMVGEGDPNCDSADQNGDGTVDPLDSGYVLARFGCPVGTGDDDCDAADQNGDGAVDPLDSGFVLARFGCPVGTGDPSCDAADVNGDGAVDPLDSGFVLARFGPCD
ncbi:MAG: hypothetical protein IID37_08500, partial [Planctomycetes bacterium]|nr:hypothetical protein [Planctomycetota bacterium]